MASWDDGYVTDVGYTDHFHRETTPAWLAMAALLLGYRPPDLAKPFRYADLGCGNGLTALIVAATTPQAEVWAFDFNPAHIEAGRTMAAAAGLTNIRFEEASFAQIAAMPDDALPPFDFVVAHGVLTWLSPENTKLLIGLIGQLLRPGGLAFVSYNVATGWSGIEPLRALMRLLADRMPQRSDLAVPGIWAFLDRLKAGGATFFNGTPAMDTLLMHLRVQDPRYVAHELLNEHWRPVMFGDVSRALGDVKCQYIGSATLADNIDAVSVPPGVQPLLAEAPDLIARETMRDIGTAQLFRRDLYRRGAPPLSRTEHHALLEEVTLEWTGKAAPGDITFQTALGTMTANADAYRPLLTRLEAGPLSVGQAGEIGPFPGRPTVELLQAIALLIAGGYAHPMLPDGAFPGRESAARLNRALAAANANGSEYHLLAAPGIGTAMTVDVTETLVAGDLLTGHPADADSLTASLGAHFRRGGRTIYRDGQAVTDPKEAADLTATIVRRVLNEQTGILRRLGVLEG